jgi:hypothetical protein
MGKKIYKYIGPDILEVAFKKRDCCGFKFSYAKDYNDLFELFLNIDFKGQPNAGAFYNEVIQEIPQYPITCFSNSPIVTPMWAHYAHNSKGFVIEVDEDRLRNFDDDIAICDVRYQDGPREELVNIFNMAFGRSKPRDLMKLRDAVQHISYFTKHSCWGYESERRLLVSIEKIVKESGNMIMYFPVSCITSIISGPKTTDIYIKKKQLSYVALFRQPITRSRLVRVSRIHS